MPETVQRGVQVPLFEDNLGGFAPGATETRTIVQLEAMNAAKPFDAPQQLLAEAARALAQNIDAGNRKGRAIGNEVAQLLAVIATLTQGEEDAPTESDIPDETREFIHALAAVPRIDRAAPVDHTA